MASLAIIGFGNRGMMFGKIAKEENVKVTAVCDSDAERCDEATVLCGVPKNMVFTDAEKFFAQGKLADVLLISTLDETHHEIAIKAMETGYDILLEKPIALKMEDILNINETANKLGCKVGVCHVLRYMPMYKKMKELIDSGVIGKVMNISQTENVGYYHFAHSFVRGNWHNSKETCPSILAKCCHDLDLIVWLTGKNCLALSSFGGLNYFTAENAPAGATERCKDCPHKNVCTYSGYVIYSLHPTMVKQPCIREYTVENAFDVLNDNNTCYDKCVYKCDNDVCDHQEVIMTLEDGVLGHLTMQAFSGAIYRRTQVCGSLGEINATIEQDGKMTLSLFGKEERSFDFTSTDELSHHSGSDRLLFKDFMRFVDGNGKSVCLTDISKSIESHVMALKAEESRLNNGKSVTLNLNNFKL